MTKVRKIFMNDSRHVVKSYKKYLHAEKKYKSMLETSKKSLETATKWSIILMIH